MRVRAYERFSQLTWLAGLLMFLNVGYVALVWNGPIAPPFVGWIVPLLLTALGVAATFRMTFRAPLDRAASRFWRQIAVAVLIIGLGAVSQLNDALGGPDAPSQLLSLRTIAIDLTGLAIIMVAMLTLPVNRLSAGAWVTFALDAGTVLAGSALFTWYLSVRTMPDFVATTGSKLPMLGTVGAAFLGVLAILKISFAGVRAVDTRSLHLLAVAALTGSCTAGMGTLLASRPHLNASILAYPMAYGFLTIAVQRQYRVALAPASDRPVRQERRFGVLNLLPYAAVALVDGLLLASVGKGDNRLVAVGAVLLTALVVARQLVTFAENSRLLRRLDTTVGELQASENRLTFQATHDALTGLANRALLAEHIEDALDLPAGPEDVAMALIDLDDFKSVNDRLGHIVGDTLLVAAAARVRDSIGPDDLVARLGGDEFAVLFRGVGGEPCAAARRIEQILRALAKPLRIDGDELRIRASVGLADGWPEAEYSELVRRADVAMYAAKGSADGGWVRFTPALDAPAADQARLARGLREGLGRGDFRLVYQPIVTLPEQRIAGVEALIRWHDPERGVIPPDRFIPVAERSGLIVPLGRWVLREACAQAAEWRREFGAAAPERVCVNVSPRQLDEADFVSDVVAALADTGLPASYLVVEVTETAVFDGGAAAVEALNALRAIGVRVALDDFGTGQSSLGLLLTCPVDILKVDKSFVDGVTEPGDRAVIVEFLSQVAHGLQLDTVAEGVEEPAQAQRLHELGYRKGQGYLFSRPLPAAELAPLLTAVREQETLNA